MESNTCILNIWGGTETDSSHQQGHKKAQNVGDRASVPFLTERRRNHRMTICKSMNETKWALQWRMRKTPVLGASMGDPTHDKVVQRDLTGQGESGLEGSSAWASTPKPKSVCLLSAILYSSDITGGYPRPPFSGNSLELPLVSCIWKECFSSNPSDGSLTCLTVGDFYKLWLFTAPQPWEVWSLKHLKDIEPFRAKN